MKLNLFPLFVFALVAFTFAVLVVSATALPTARPADSCGWMYDKAQAEAIAGDRDGRFNRDTSEFINVKYERSRTYAMLYMACREHGRAQ